MRSGFFPHFLVGMRWPIALTMPYAHARDDRFFSRATDERDPDVSER